MNTQSTEATPLENNKGQTIQGSPEGSIPDSPGKELLLQRERPGLLLFMSFGGLVAFPLIGYFKDIKGLYILALICLVVFIVLLMRKPRPLRLSISDGNLCLGEPGLLSFKQIPLNKIERMWIYHEKLNGMDHKRCIKYSSGASFSKQLVDLESSDGSMSNRQALELINFVCSHKPGIIIGPE